MPPYAIVTCVAPKPGTLISRSPASMNDGTFVNSTSLTLPSAHWQRASINPAGASINKRVSGSIMALMPVSSTTVATQIALDPDMRGYLVATMIMKPTSSRGYQHVYRVGWSAAWLEKQKAPEVIAFRLEMPHFLEYGFAWQ